ncbi:uncharacterized protein LOC124895244 [Capsicum annuum]|uniref:uncharacterized protein LOC124895244 n=1 Tax=Capsicum annuum TaxID=4072 RepID=UPI001FB04E6D|nr:uncharacterized protein LOC124895244 [Capsicum annuum]
MVRGTAEHEYHCVPAFSYMIDTLNDGTTYSIMVNKVDCRFMYYFLSLGPCIRGFTHMRKVIAVDDTHLYGKYEGLLLSVVAQNTENHIYPIAFCIVNKENDTSWTFFFKKLKSIMVNGPYLCFIFNRHKSIANGITKTYNHAHHGAYFSNNGFDVITTNIVESVNAMLIDKREYLVASIFNSIAKRFSEIFRERCAYVLKCKDNKFVPAIKKILRDNLSEGDSFYVENISGHERQYTVFGSGSTAKVDLREMSCSCRKFDLVKIPCDHAMAALRSKHGDDYGLSVYDYSSPL